MFHSTNVHAGALPVLLLTLSISGAAQSSAARRAAKPDLHAGGFKPSSIMNREVTDVTLPGFHFTGARVETEPMCPVVSYEVVSDNEIRMKLRGNRDVDEASGQCGVTIRTAAGSASSWLYVELTDAEKKEQQSHQNAKDLGKYQQFLARTGKSWRVTYSNGTTETYAAMPSDPNAAGLPGFRSTSGRAIQVAVGEDNGVTIIDNQCMRGGKLVGAEVKNGQSQGNCSPPGAWTATVTR